MNKGLYFLFTCVLILCNYTSLFAYQVNTMQVKGRLTTDTLRVDTILSNNTNKRMVVLDTLLLAGLKSANAEDSIVTVDPITGQLRRKSVASIGGTNIYNNDGTLTGNRIVTMSNNSLNFTGGNIGIGNANPWASLHFGTNFVNKRLILYQTINNEHQFSGFGVSSNILRYHVDAPSTSHVFYAGIDASSSKELLRITGDGNVGIGNSNPWGLLHFANTDANRKIIFYQPENNDHEFYGFGVNSGVLRYHVDAPISSHVFYSGIDANNSKELMRIQGNGQVLISSLISTNTSAGASATDSIVMVDPTTGELRRRKNIIINGTIYIADGTLTANRTVTMAGNNLNFTGGNIGISRSNPFVPLHLDDGAANRKLILYQTVNNDHDFYGFGIGTGTLRYQVGILGSHVFYSGIDANSSKELMRIQGDGKVLIPSLVSTNTIASANATDSVVMVDPTTGELRRRDASKIDGNLYATDGTLTGNRTVNMSNNNLSFIGGNVGIGNANPFGPLQFINSGVNRKLILYQMLNNDHQFYGFGIGIDILRYQVEVPTASHVFYAGIDANSSKELMRIQGDGKVLIPSLVSTNDLASANATDSILTVNPTTGELRRRDAFKINSNIYNANGTLTANRTVTMAGNNLNFTGGNIGIGNANPLGPLHFDNTAANRKIILRQTANSDHQFYGFGLNGGGVLRYQTADTRYHIFYSGIDANNSKKLVTIAEDDSRGSVGIGVFPDMIGIGVKDGTTTLTYSLGTFIDGANSLRTTNSVTNVSIYASGTIMAGEQISAAFGASYSDKRIKKDITLSDGKLDLNILNKIKVSNYKLIDSLAQGLVTHKKVIAQELEQVYPQAVNTATNYIPNVYQVSEKITYLSDTVALISFNKPLDSECVVGKKIRFHDEKGKELFGFIKEVKEKSLVISQVSKNQKTIFVYGVEVNNFKSVDYDELAMLNVSATQEIYKKMITQKNTIQQFKTNVQQSEMIIKNLKANLQQRAKQIEEFFKLLKQ